MKAQHAIFAFLLALFPFAACDCSDDPVEMGCTSDMECPAGQRCAPPSTEGAKRECVANPECLSDEECVDDDPRKRCDTEVNKYTCVFREGFDDECDAMHPCAFGQFCSTLLGRCLDAGSSRDCTRRSQCPANQICDRTASKCIEDTGCYGDAFCETGEICDLVNHICRSLSIECTSCLLSGTCEGSGSCTADTKECLSGNMMPACRTGERCDPLGRCVQCTNSDECGPGLFCNTSLGRCESNVQCADDPSLCPESPDVTCVMCMLPQICDPRSKKCQAPATVCETDVDCPGDQYCDMQMDPPICVPRIPDCLDDLLDTPRNDHYVNAALLEPSLMDFEELKLCPGDNDWYQIDVTAGTYLTVDVRFRHSEGDLDVKLFLADGTTLVDESRSTNDNERVELEAGTDLTLLMRVFYAVPSINPTNYRLIVARDSTEQCADDANEPDDLPSTAKALTSDMPYEGRLCSADPDWFLIPGVPGGTTINASLQFVDSLGDLDLELYRVGQQIPLLDSRSLDDDEEISYDASYGGDYYLRVVGKAADTNVYTIRADLRENPNAVCLDDRFEPNDLPSTSTVADPILNTLIDLTLCEGDEDWFDIELGPGEALTAEIGFLPSADLELRLYENELQLDPRSTPLRASTNVFPREYLTYRTGPAQDLLLRVHGHGSQDISPYQLRIGRLPPMATCAEDAVDSMLLGDTQAEAFEFPFPAPGRIDDLTLCTGDDDWFHVLLPAAYDNIIRLQYPSSDAVLDMAIHDFAGNLLVQTGGGGDVKMVNAPIPGVVGQFGEIWVHVLRSSGFEATYNLTHDIVPIFSCFPDFSEPNDVIEMPSLVASSSMTPSFTLGGLTLCPNTRNELTFAGDLDWFELNPPAIGARINASITFLQGDLSLELLGPLGTRACINFGPDRCYSDGFDLDELITYTSTLAGPYYLVVGSVYSSPNIPFVPREADTPYTLNIQYEVP